MFKVKVNVTAKVQNVTDCSPGWCLLNDLTFCSQTLYGNASLWARVVCEKCFAIFKVKVTVWYHIIVSTMSSAVVILSQPNLVWWDTIISLPCEKTADCFVQSRKVHNRGSTSHWIFQFYIFCTTDLCYQNRCADVLVLITRPSANKLDIHVDSNSNLQYLCALRVVFHHTRRQTVLTSNSIEVVLVLLTCRCMWVKYIGALKRSKLQLRWELRGKMCEEVQLSRPRPKSEIAQCHRKERWWYCLFCHWDA